jgi:hypothetical protein
MSETMTFDLGLDKVTITDRAVVIRGKLGAERTIPIRNIADVRVSGLLRDLVITDNSGRKIRPRGFRLNIMADAHAIADAINERMQ